MSGWEGDAEGVEDVVGVVCCVLWVLRVLYVGAEGVWAMGWLVDIERGKGELARATRDTQDGDGVVRRRRGAEMRRTEVRRRRGGGEGIAVVVVGGRERTRGLGRWSR